ncbi:MAG: dihydrolipoyl dehydrogenase [Candidatus Sericytochromatia bacterium]|nr:dihydrolipoyl dehydrogenase [Candidatus Sericytochromatia bacterium]
MESQVFDLVVIGGGPGGYVAAIRAAQAGLRTACVEREPALGGTCLRVGCIPSKALLESSERYLEAVQGLAAHGVRVEGVSLDLATMMGRKDEVVRSLTQGIDGLFKKNGVTRFLGHGRLDGAGRVVVEQSEGSEILLTASNIILATGSRVASLKGVEVDGLHVGTSTEALSYDKVPEHLVVIGGGVIGLELGSVWARLGAKVTVLEYLPRILGAMEPELAKEAQRVFARQGIEFRLGVKVSGTSVRADGQVEVALEGDQPVVGDRVLLATGRVPNTEGLGLETVGLQTGPRGVVPIDDQFRTGVPGVWAIGDLVRGPMLAHKAEEEGVACVDLILRGHGHVDYMSIPSVVYTEPEIASVGRTTEELDREGISYRKGSFAFRGNGRARALGHVEGKALILAHAETDRVLGVHVIGPRAGDLIAEAAVAMAFGASSEDIALASHAHPTLAEVLKEAALAVTGKPIHA